MVTNRKGGRKPKLEKATHRYVFRLTDSENAKFQTLFEQSGLDKRAKFIISLLFERKINSVIVDKGAIDYCTKLSQFFAQFRAIGVNYNQIVKILHTNFSDKKTVLYIGKLEEQTKELAAICRDVLILSKKFEAEYLVKKGKL
ncbi:conjugal transfer protein MobA [Chryseobacterium camelliae]|uniref:conjugal transfer protein MobA n=1 Tax=Chryseobacterium camelliae TaxID=1265445 RepID=UPI000C1CB986|nr:conjugal transfer protein MobA [Chryseobacterium camelliae]